MQRNSIKKIIFSFTLSFIFFASPLAISMNVNASRPIEISNLKSAQFTPSDIRVAIYEDSNITRPSYTNMGVLTNNFSLIETILKDAGFQVFKVTTEQIYNHELLTANYDVFIMADNLPKENITNQVKEFWLSGGGLLTFDSVAAYLCWSGILPPESEGDDGYSIYWSNQAQSSANISLLHPVTRDYDVGDTFTFGSTYSWSTFDWSALMGTSIASDLYRLANKPGDLNAVTVLGYDPSNNGGRLVHILTIDELDANSIIINAVEWLCPQPKARIVFDLSHHPRLGIDDWDDLTQFPGYYGTFRDELVSRGYTFDKLYPSSTANFSASRLNSYDLLILVSPDSDYSSSDSVAVTNWINKGGSVLVLGDSPTLSDFAVTNDRINNLLASFDLQLNDTVGIGGSNALTSTNHPTIEGCTTVTMNAMGTINVSGDAYAIWKYGADVIIAGQEAGSGRIIMVGDMNWCADGNIATTNNRQFAINVVNWLTSWDADVLIYTDEAFSTNYYKTPLSMALNSLKMNFYLTFTDDYLNYSLNTGSWKLLVIDLVDYVFAESVFDNVKAFVDAGGHLLMTSYLVDSYPSNPLWATLGFSYASNFPNNDPFYIWEDTNPIFNKPYDYNATLFQPFTFYSDDGDLLTVYDNATALAGYNASETNDNAVIVLRNDKRTLYNGFIIDELSGDHNLNGFKDSLELWTNELTFMLDQAGLLPKEGPTPFIPGYELLIIFGVLALTTSGLIIIHRRKKNLD